MNVVICDTPDGTSTEPLDPLDKMAPTLFRPTGAEGVYARTALYEEVLEALAATMSRLREKDTEILRLPPVMTRGQLERSGYLKSFPHLLGCICSLRGTEPEINAAIGSADSVGDWTSNLAPIDLVLSPAACYPVYPMAAACGAVPQGGLRFDVACECFRQEPSRHLYRLRTFRMREFVCIGPAAEVINFRERWMVRARALADRLGLTYRMETASDPFFGRVGQMMAIGQRQQSLKFELLVQLRSIEEPVACMSFNYHGNHFGTVWELRDSTGSLAHTGCVAFGMDRLAVAMFLTHGLDVQQWPASVRSALEI
jgi:seryl-tRNA synthetase